uniref:Uncharacterized protein n=1 Tax=Leersia perrieri TaxID=77586 RepID=A0A0D9VDN1_9ORYZ
MASPAEMRWAMAVSQVRPPSSSSEFARDERKLQSPASRWLYARSSSCKFVRDPKDGTIPVSPVATR